MNDEPVPPAPATPETSAPDASAQNAIPAQGIAPASAAAAPALSAEALAKLEAARVRDKRIGLAMVAVAFVLSLAISLWAKRVSGPELGVAPDPPTTEGISGFPEQVDPLKGLVRARGLTPRPFLRGIVMEGVKPDGTVDVKTGGEIRYTFQSPAGHGPQPPRKPGVVPRKNNCGRQNVRIHTGGIAADPDQPGIPCALSPLDPLPEPRCSMDKVWAAALRKGATKSARARIEYYRSMAGPAFRIEVPGSLRLNLYGDCERELGRSESASVPQ